MSQFYKTREETEEWLNKINIKNYSINDDLNVDVNGDVHLNNENLKTIPLRFNKVSGSFNCSNNQLTSLEGSPKEIGGSFHCYNNQLTSLEGCPKVVSRDFFCFNNKLTTLEFLPESVFEDIWFDDMRNIYPTLPENGKTHFLDYKKEQSKILIAKEKSTIAQSLEDLPIKQSTKPKFKM